MACLRSSCQTLPSQVEYSGPSQPQTEGLRSPKLASIAVRSFGTVENLATKDCQWTDERSLDDQQS